MPATHRNAGIAASCPIAVKGDAVIQSFAQALAFLQAHGDHAGAGGTAVVGTGTRNVTLIVLGVDPGGQPDTMGVRLYDTVIVVYHADETYSSSSGGHMTNTTVTRLNQFTPGSYRRHDRVLRNRGAYGDRHANRFVVHPGDGEPRVRGVETLGPTVKRDRAAGPHGTVRWLADADGTLYSTNSLHPGEMVFPVLNYDEIGKDGDYTGPLTYTLVRQHVRHYETRDLAGFPKNEVPLNVANAHRRLWGMPAVTMVEA